MRFWELRLLVKNMENPQKTILKIQVLELGAAELFVKPLQIYDLPHNFSVSDTCYQALRGTYNFRNHSLEAEKAVWQEFTHNLNMSDNADEVWRECWLKGYTELHHYKMLGNGKVLRKSLNDTTGYTCSVKGFNQLFNLYPDLSDSRVYTWEMGEHKVKFVQLFNKSYHKIHCEYGEYSKIRGADPKIVEILNGLVFVSSFPSVFAELQDYKYENQKPSPKYEIEWTEVKPTQLTYNWQDLKAKTFAKQAGEYFGGWFDKLGIKVWQCEVREI